MHKKFFRCATFAPQAPQSLKYQNRELYGPPSDEQKREKLIL